MSWSLRLPPSDLGSVLVLGDVTVQSFGCGRILGLRNLPLALLVRPSTLFGPPGPAFGRVS